MSKPFVGCSKALPATHVRVVVRYSMGGAQAVQWAVSHLGFGDRIVAYCGTATTYPRDALRLESGIAALTADTAIKDRNHGSLTFRLTGFERHPSSD